ncbi:IS630 family transposase [Rhodopseudomonas palustris]|uniref:IS630 family transposase n=1 Tax=Rhodopseudomonas palustris TaxID=1076 RepID=A0A323UP25_RHOPL|nr:IS630 family transposase [Rhodopseudomonas palustris]PZA09438.1 IS630 family transposase [Rhodopseudomonas palustris]
MGRAYSTDLRERVVGAVIEGGLSCHQAAAQFGVGISTAILWVQRFRRTGSVEPDKIGGYKPRKIAGAHEDWLLRRCREADFTLRGLVAELGERGLKVDYRSVWEFVHRAKLSHKKTLIAAEQSRPDVARRRTQWCKYRGRIDPGRLVFIDETWTKTNMAPLRGWAPRGQRLKASVPHAHWQTLTFLAALRCDGVTAPWLLEGPINGESFRLYVESILVPTLRPGDIVIMDNLGSHKGHPVRTAIRAAGARLLFLPKYSPDLNPIEQFFAKLKHWLRKAAQRTADAVSAAIGEILKATPPTECSNYFTNAGYDQT